MRPKQSGGEGGVEGGGGMKTLDWEEELGWFKMGLGGITQKQDLQQYEDSFQDEQ